MKQWYALYVFLYSNWYLMSYIIVHQLSNQIYIIHVLISTMFVNRSHRIGPQTQHQWHHKVPDNLIKIYRGIKVAKHWQNCVNTHFQSGSHHGWVLWSESLTTSFIHMLWIMAIYNSHSRPDPTGAAYLVVTETISQETGSGSNNYWQPAPAARPGSTRPVWVILPSKY